MATLKEMLDFSGTFDMAEFIAKKMFKDGTKDALLDLRLLYMAQGKFEEVDALDKEIDQYFFNDPRVLFGRSWQKLREGDLREGLRLMEFGRGLHNFGIDPMKTSMPKWNGNPDIAGKFIIMWCEEGYGDEIINVRFAKKLAEMGAKPIVACSGAMITLFSRVEGVSAVLDKQVAQACYHDMWYPAMSAPLLCGYTNETLPGKPYLKAHPDLLNSYKGLLSHPGKKVGLRWSGNPNFEDEKFRRFPLEKMIDLKDTPGIQFYSFQRDDNLIQVPSPIIDIGPILKGWEDTAAALSCMDLMITSCTSVAHLSAALGVETWVILPIMCYYIWALPGEKSPWYDSVTLFRQTRFGDWEEPFENIKNKLVEDFLKR